MKKINLRYIMVVIALMTALTSCFDNESFHFKKQWVAFDDAELGVLESEPDPVEVTFVYSGALKDEPITINYSLSSEDAIENSDYTLATGFGTVVIPAGEASVTVPVFTIIDNLIEDGNKVISIEIESAGDLPVGFPGPDHKQSVLEVTIEDNDCAFDDDFWSGTFSALEDYGASTYGPYDIELVQDATNANRFEFDNFYDSGCTAFMIFDGGNISVNFPNQSPCGAPLTNSTGTFNQCLGTITINLHFDGADWTYRFTKK